jgi:hypothetical protein
MTGEKNCIWRSRAVGSVHDAGVLARVIFNDEVSMLSALLTEVDENKR